MAQDGYRPQWDASGRDDLGIMKRMGANAIRLYHPIGEEPGTQPDHGGLLDAAGKQGLKVFGAVHQYLSCTDEDDCYSNWNTAVAHGLKAGFAKGGVWHEAVSAINMINEVDAIVPFQEGGRQVKRIISAVDGLLMAEKAAGVRGTVNLTSCFTTAIAQPLGDGPSSVYHGFSSMQYWIDHPSSVTYTPKFGSMTDLAREIDRRWMHCVNAQIPWKNGLEGMIAANYAPFMPRPWFIGEMGFNGQHQDVITQELTDMHTYAQSGKGFAGSYFFQFQTAYFKTGAELNFGMFGLGADIVGKTGTLKGRTFDIHCLTSREYAFEQPDSGCKEECDYRAKAVVKAFGGEISGSGVCLDAPPLKPVGLNREIVV